MSVNVSQCHSILGRAPPSKSAVLPSKGVGGGGRGAYFRFHTNDRDLLPNHSKYRVCESQKFFCGESFL